MIHDKLFYHDTKGKLRSWQAETEGDRYRVIAGLEDGKKVTSAWKVAKPKNIGKKNATDGAAQCLAEVDALYIKNAKKGWAITVDQITTPYIKPMLAYDITDLTKPINFTKKVFVQPKLDGFRCIISRDGIKSRDGERFFNCDHIAEKFFKFFLQHTDIIALDGELYNHILKDDFSRIQTLLRTQTATAELIAEARRVIQFHCYDVITEIPLTFDRRQLLLEMVLPVDDNVIPVNTAEVISMEQINLLKIAAEKDGYEGVMIRINDIYHNKRTKSLIKFKRLKDAEFTIDDVNEGTGNWAGYAKTVTITLENGIKCYPTVKGNREFAKQLLDEKDYWIGKKVTVEYDSVGSKGSLRFCQAVKFHHGDLEHR